MSRPPMSSWPPPPPRTPRTPTARQQQVARGCAWTILAAIALLAVVGAVALVTSR